MIFNDDYYNGDQEGDNEDDGVSDSSNYNSVCWLF